VVTVHDLSYLRFPETVNAASLRYRALVPRSVRRAAVVCTPSHAVAEEVRSQYQPDVVVVTPLGVDASWLAAPRPDRSWLSARGLPERYLLFVGTLEPRKNLPTLLAAYAALRGTDPQTPPLVLAGPPGWGRRWTPPAAAGRGCHAGYLDLDTLQRASPARPRWCCRRRTRALAFRRWRRSRAAPRWSRATSR